MTRTASLVPVQPAVRDFVHALGFGARRQMAHPEGQVVQVKTPSLVFGDPVDEAKRPARRRQVDLHAVRQAGPVAPLFVAGEQSVDLLPLPFQPGARFLADSQGAATGASQVLLPGEVVKGDAREALLEGDGSALAVRRADRAVLGLELRQRRGLMAQPGKDRLRGGLRRQHDAPPSELLLEHIAPTKPAAEGDMNLFRHRPIVATAPRGFAPRLPRPHHLPQSCIRLPSLADGAACPPSVFGAHPIARASKPSTPDVPVTPTPAGAPA